MRVSNQLYNIAWLENLVLVDYLTQMHRELTVVNIFIWVDILSGSRYHLLRDINIGWW